MLMIENIVRHYAQPAGDHLSVAANDRFGLALLHQFCTSSGRCRLTVMCSCRSIAT